MESARPDWEDELGRWLKPFLERLGHKARQRMCPRYVAGLIGPGDRKSVAPVAERFAPGGYDRLHHFVGAGVWDALRWRLSFSSRLISSLAAEMRCW